MHIAPISYDYNNKTSFKELIIDDEEYTLKNDGKTVKKLLKNKQVKKLVKHYEFEGKNVLVNIDTVDLADWVNFYLLDKNNTESEKELLDYVNKCFIWAINANRMINKYNKSVKNKKIREIQARNLKNKLNEFNKNLKNEISKMSLFEQLSRFRV